MKKIFFFNNSFSLNLRQRDLSDWIHECVQERGAKIKRLDINFIKEDEMLKLNQKHLKDENHTDILTFSYSDQLRIEAEIFISIERACENAKIHSETLDNEVLRLISHGLLHVFGMEDSTKAMREEMNEEENKLMRRFHVKHIKSEKVL